MQKIAQVSKQTEKLCLFVCLVFSGIFFPYDICYHDNVWKLFSVKFLQYEMLWKSEGCYDY